ncbi:uncharacterized protein LOC144635639 [Oculina patagonica]
MKRPADMEFMFVSFVAILFSIAATSADQALHLKSYSEDQVEGCYIHNQTLGVCFDIRKDLMKLLKTTGEQIVLHMKLGPEMLFYQVLDQTFIGNDASMVYVPNDVPRTPEALRGFLRRKKGMAEHEALKNHYQEVMSELHYVPEVQLLERVSAALSDNSTRLEILEPFYVLCLNLLKASDVEIPSELKAAPDTTEQVEGRQKRSCQRPQANDCRGLCGKGCWCWSWVCGDCCHHQGCYEHDLCCKYNPTSPHCISPYSYGFQCSGFGGYQDCLSWSWWG